MHLFSQRSLQRKQLWSPFAIFPQQNLICHGVIVFLATTHCVTFHIEGCIPRRMLRLVCNSEATEGSTKSTRWFVMKCTLPIDDPPWNETLWNHTKYVICHNWFGSMLCDPLCYEPSSSCSWWEVLPDFTILMCKQLSAEKNGCHWEVDSCLTKAAVCLKICEGENTWKSFDPIPCHLLFLRHHPSSHVSGHRMRTPEMARHAAGVTFQRWIVRTLGQSMRASPPRLTVEINSSTCFCLCYLVPAFFLFGLCLLVDFRFVDGPENWARTSIFHFLDKKASFCIKCLD